MNRPNIKIPVIILISIVITGTIGFHIIEGANLLDSLYWTVITLATVGYGDIPPETQAGRLFTVFLVTIGVGVILYTFSLIGKNIIEGSIWEIFTVSEKADEVEKLSNHLIVCGYGAIGQAVTEQLLLGDEEVVIIDLNEEVLRIEATDLPYIAGDATQEDVLEKAGCERARGLFATLPKDSDNIMLVLSAKEINPEIRIIAKSEGMEAEKHIRRAGAEAVIHPDSEGGIRMARSFLHPEVTSLYDHMLQGDAGKAGAMEVQKGSLLDGNTIKESGLREDIGISVIAIRRDDELIVNPTINEEIQAEDTLIIMGTPAQIKKMKGKYS